MKTCKEYTRGKSQRISEDRLPRTICLPSFQSTSFLLAEYTEELDPTNQRGLHEWHHALSQEDLFAFRFHQRCRIRLVCPDRYRKCIRRNRRYRDTRSKKERIGETSVRHPFLHFYGNEWCLLVICIKLIVRFWALYRSYFSAFSERYIFAYSSSMLRYSELIRQSEDLVRISADTFRNYLLDKIYACQLHNKYDKVSAKCFDSSPDLYANLPFCSRKAQNYLRTILLSMWRSRQL